MMLPAVFAPMMIDDALPWRTGFAAAVPCVCGPTGPQRWDHLRQTSPGGTIMRKTFTILATMLGALVMAAPVAAQERGAALAILVGAVVAGSFRLIGKRR